MPSNTSIARLGAKAFLDMTAADHNGHDYAWLVNELKRLEVNATTKREICEAMNITGPTFDKYRFVINLERAQQNGGEK